MGKKALMTWQCTRIDAADSLDMLDKEVLLT